MRDGDGVCTVYAPPLGICFTSYLIFHTAVDRNHIYVYCAHLLRLSNGAVSVSNVCEREVSHDFCVVVLLCVYVLHVAVI